MTNKSGNFFTNLFKKKEEESKTEKIMDQRSKIKDQMAENLRKLNFTTMEISEVLNLITVTESKIEMLKTGLIGSNIDNDPRPIQEKTVSKIRELQTQLQEDIRNKVAEIQKRKNKA